MSKIVSNFPREKWLETMHISAMDNQVENCEEIDKEDIHFLEVKENSRADLSCRGTFNTQIRSAEKKIILKESFRS